MPVPTKCPRCGAVCGLPDTFKGGNVRCPTCQNPFAVPAPQAVPKTTATVPTTAAATPFPSVPPTPKPNAPPQVPVQRSFLLADLTVVGSLCIGLFALALPVFAGLYLLGLVLADFPAIGSIVGLVLIFRVGLKGASRHLASAAVSVAAFLVALNAHQVTAGVEANDAERSARKD
jgi:hypothetical protein